MYPIIPANTLNWTILTTVGKTTGVCTYDVLPEHLCDFTFHHVEWMGKLSSMPRLLIISALIFAIATASHFETLNRNTHGLIAIFLKEKVVFFQPLREFRRNDILDLSTVAIIFYIALMILLEVAIDLWDAVRIYCWELGLQQQPFLCGLAAQSIFLSLKAFLNLYAKLDTLFVDFLGNIETHGVVKQYATRTRNIFPRLLWIAAISGQSLHHGNLFLDILKELDIGYESIVSGICFASKPF